MHMQTISAVPASHDGAGYCLCIPQAQIPADLHKRNDCPHNSFPQALYCKVPVLSHLHKQSQSLTSAFSEQKRSGQ